MMPEETLKGEAAIPRGSMYPCPFYPCFSLVGRLDFLALYTYNVRGG
ncbi:hypothetical protein HMPREF9134_01080 [Porphyromonas catoniae F0037]|uniref:Uncharacterized protein n=1 Tax=Porphyromonas catoniae F0037 TaxID=1127696 RepID=L1ND82_9PORP|nr:hypothetical protein HMPREF9134_01080 [Porphyromonas catoniae F0037]